MLIVVLNHELDNLMLYRHLLIQHKKDQLESKTLNEKEIDKAVQDGQTNDDSVDNSVEEVIIPTITFGNYEWYNPSSVVGFNGYYDSSGKYHYLELYDVEKSVFYYNEITKQIVNEAPAGTGDNILLVQQDRDNSFLGSLLFTAEDEYGYTVIKHVNEIDDFPNKILGFKNEYPYFYIKKDGTVINQFTLCIFPRGIFDLFYKLYYPQLEFQTTEVIKQFENNDTNGYPLVTDKMIYSIFAYFFQTLNKLDVLWKASVNKEPFFIYNNGEFFVDFVFDMAVDAEQKLFKIIKTVSNIDYSDIDYEQMLVKMYNNGDFESCFRIQEYWYKEEGESKHIAINDKFKLQSVTIANQMLHANNNNLSYPDGNYDNGNESLYFYSNYIQPHYHFIRTFDSEFTSYFISSGELNDYQELSYDIQGVIPCTYCELYNVKLTINNNNSMLSQYPYHTLSDFYKKYTWQKYDENTLTNNSYTDNNTIWCMYDLKYKRDSITYTFQLPVLRINCTTDYEDSLNINIDPLVHATTNESITNYLMIISLDLNNIATLIKNIIENMTAIVQIKSVENTNITEGIESVDCYLIEECEKLMQLYERMADYTKQVAEICTDKWSQGYRNIYINNPQDSSRYYGGFIDENGNIIIPTACSKDKYPYKYYGRLKGIQNSSNRTRLWTNFLRNDAMLNFNLNLNIMFDTKPLTHINDIDTITDDGVTWNYTNLNNRILNDPNILDENGWQLNYNPDLSGSEFIGITEMEITKKTSSGSTGLVFEEKEGYSKFVKQGNYDTYGYVRLFHDIYRLIKEVDSNIFKTLVEYFNSFFQSENVIYFFKDDKDDKADFYSIFDIQPDFGNVSCDSKQLPYSDEGVQNCELKSYDPYIFNNIVSKKQALINVDITDDENPTNNINVAYFNLKIYTFCNQLIKYQGNSSNNYDNIITFQVNSVFKPFIIIYFIKFIIIEYICFHNIVNIIIKTYYLSIYIIN